MQLWLILEQIMQIYVHSNSAESHLCLTWEHLSGHQVGWMTCVKVYELHMKAAVWFLWRSSPPPLLSVSHAHSPRLRLSPPPSTHTHTRCSSGRSLLLIHTASLYLNPLSRLCRHLPPGVRGAVECYILDTLCCCCFTHRQTHTHANRRPGWYFLPHHDCRDAA